MTEGSIVAIAVAGVGLAGQVVNVFLHLRIRNAILEQALSADEKFDKKLQDYVLEKTCQATHRLEARQRY
jgi:hypothetical protein